MRNRTTPYIYKKTSKGRKLLRGCSQHLYRLQIAWLQSETEESVDTRCREGAQGILGYSELKFAERAYSMSLSREDVQCIFFTQHHPIINGPGCCIQEHSLAHRSVDATEIHCQVVVYIYLRWKCGIHMRVSGYNKPLNLNWKGCFIAKLIIWSIYSKQIEYAFWGKMTADNTCHQILTRAHDTV